MGGKRQRERERERDLLVLTSFQVSAWPEREMQNLSDAVGLPCLWMCCSFLWIWHFSTVPALSFPLCNSRNRGKETQQQSCHPPLPQLLPFSGPKNLQSTDLLFLITHNPSIVKQTIPKNKQTQWKLLSHSYQLILKVSRARVEIQIACCNYK